MPCNPDIPKEYIALLRTKVCQSNITKVMPNLVGVKFRNSLGNTNDSTSPRGEPNSVIYIEKVENLNLFQRGAILQTSFSPGNSPGWIQPGH